MFVITDHSSLTLNRSSAPPSLQSASFCSLSCVFWAPRSLRWALTSKGPHICCHWCWQADCSSDQAMGLWRVRPLRYKSLQCPVEEVFPWVAGVFWFSRQLSRTASLHSGLKERNWLWPLDWLWPSPAWAQSSTSSSRRSLKRVMACSGHCGAVGWKHKITKRNKLILLFSLFVERLRVDLV